MDKGTTSRPSSGPSYEVFLSFRGTDTRYNFTDCLYHRMIDAGIVVFRDSESLHVGKEIGGELLQAIENSKIYIPIFSESYASSDWCLRELAYMVECTSKSNGNKEIMPIFFNVEPGDVKLKTDLYRQTLSKRQKISCSEVKSWEKALTAVGNIKGWNWKKDQGQEDLIRSMIRTVSVKLKVAQENVPEHLVGVEDRAEFIIRMLDVESDGVRFLGIHGMGGVGKTTLAKVVFNKLSSNFDKCCFLMDIGESSKGIKGLVKLQKQLLSKLLGSHYISQIHHVNDGINMMERGVLGNEKFLIVLDDVDEKEQLKSLAKKGSWFGSGSRIIITTRDRSVLKIEGEATGEGPNVSTYEAREMEFYHALELFSRHAFRSYRPSDKFTMLSKEIVRTLGNLPLALEITGSSLNSKSEALWVDTLKKLREAPPEGVQKKLMVTYEKLDDAQKEVFLDIACFFVNQDKTYPFYMWDACEYYPHDAFEVLFLMSLIKINDDNTFWMHDQVRDLGRKIVRQKNFRDHCKHSRVWNCEEALSIVKKKKGSKKIEALSLGYHHDIVTHEGFAELRNLRFLEGTGMSLVGDFNNLLCKLRWLSWSYCPKFETTNFHPVDLIVLDLSRSNISEEWNGWNQLREASKLKVLDLSYCTYLKRTPDLSAWVFLEKLILAYCDQLIEIHPSIVKLDLLTTLNLDGCNSLLELPKVIGSLQASVEIVMPFRLHGFNKPSDMQSLLAVGLPNKMSSILPHLINVLVNVRRLNLSGCTRLEELPNSIGKLQSLVELNVSDCTNLKELPNSIGKLQSLVKLDLSYCTNLKELPNSIGKLQSLVELDLSDCTNLKELPNSVGKLQSLVELDLSSTSIGHLPNSIGNLKQLKVLRMRCMNGMTEVPSAIWLLEKLEELDVSGSHDLTGEISEEIGRLSCLRILDLSDTCISRLPRYMYIQNTYHDESPLQSPNT